MNKDKREILLETFGSLPEDQDGKKLKGVTFGKPEVGDVRLTLHGTWAEMMAEQNLTGQRPIAIYEDTHRADGTSMELPEMPNVKGCRNEFFGTGMVHADMGKATGYICHNGHCWRVWENDLHPAGGNHTHYARLFKITKPTTLEDLFEGGNCWVIYEADQSHMVVGTEGTMLIFRGDTAYIKDLSNAGHRWSNNPRTPHADANEFKA